MYLYIQRVFIIHGKEKLCAGQKPRIGSKFSGYQWSSTKTPPVPSLIPRARERGRLSLAPHTAAKISYLCTSQEKAAQL